LGHQLLNAAFGSFGGQKEEGTTTQKHSRGKIIHPKHEEGGPSKRKRVEKIKSK